jgi:hypothetical protein
MRISKARLNIAVEVCGYALKTYDLQISFFFISVPIKTKYENIILKGTDTMVYDFNSVDMCDPINSLDQKIGMN